MRPIRRRRARSRADSRPTGRTTLPTLTLHAIDDPTAFVELESAYRAHPRTRRHGDLLVQSFSDESRAQLPERARSTRRCSPRCWTGSTRASKPTPASLAARCAVFEPTFNDGGKDRCRFRTDYRSPPLEARVPVR